VSVLVRSYVVYLQAGLFSSLLLCFFVFSCMHVIFFFLNSVQKDLSNTVFFSRLSHSKQGICKKNMVSPTNDEFPTLNPAPLAWKVRAVI
jgi:hypothetical protein